MTLAAQIDYLVDGWPIDGPSEDRLSGLAYEAGRLALRAAVQAVVEVESEQRARVTATDAGRPVWKDGETLSAGIFHVGMYIRGAIRALLPIANEPGCPHEGPSDRPCFTCSLALAPTHVQEGVAFLRAEIVRLRERIERLEADQEEGRW